MFIVIYTFIWLAVLAVTNLFSFVLGRCARKLPVIDYGLPWVMHRSAVPPPDAVSAPYDLAAGPPAETQRRTGPRPAA